MKKSNFQDSTDIQIVSYEPKYQSAFKNLNVEWISEFFEMEEPDYRALDHPQEFILDPGGKIFVALYRNEPVGVCALIKMDGPDYDYELAKMAVSPKAQGKGVGWKLGQAVVRSAKESGASKIYLEGNTRLTASIKLYEKLGFQKITGLPSSYQRVDIQMELDLKTIQ